mmetsp:Transcript_16917/g.44744  ORF Transcript_16917/g.44744 Transcript_16917/m.44744 type:complete len:222 (+) Transcript_16917:84-749(+)
MPMSSLTWKTLSAISTPCFLELVKMHVLGLRLFQEAGSCSMPLFSTNSLSSPMTVVEVPSSKASVGLWIARTSGFATRARAIESKCLCDRDTTSPHTSCSSEARRSSSSSGSRSRLQMAVMRSTLPSGSPSGTPNARFSRSVPWKNRGSLLMCSTLRCAGMKKPDLLSTVGISAPPMALSSVDLPPPRGPTKEMSCPCATSKRPSSVMSLVRYSPTWLRMG